MYTLIVDSHRKAPRWTRKLTFEADGLFRGDVTDLSAVGMRLVVKRDKAIEAGEALLAGTLTFEDGSHVRIKVRVARVTLAAEDAELGLEIAEADKSFYDALPRLQKGTGENPLPPEQ